ncbi:MAG: uracil-DNA glycosylase [Chlamydiales bacterium]|nr:uracil-DNA glycosylase [Chlamydiia bacterium]MCP5507437.1 uracil-DNA glycosylase [Chlamydiales bacterium]
MNSQTECPFAIEPSWNEALEEELQQPYITELAEFVKMRRETNGPVYPPEDCVFNALWKTPIDKVKVVIMGQDPYHGPGQAHGLSFSVMKGTPKPPSLRNIFLELEKDLGIPDAPHGCLEAWAEQGVLLLNATLTVEEGKPMSHHKKGWERFTDAIVRKVCEKNDPKVFILWGKNAQDKCQHILDEANGRIHHVITSAHPSPLSANRGFFGSRPFSKVNEFLVSVGKKPIDWRIT